MLVNTPPMGWNSWNTFGRKISESLIKEMADKIVELGLDKAGYQYVVIDDCWSERQRDGETGRIIPDHEKFPNGMRVVSDYIHSKGLKFGMYSCAGVRTCADYPGSFDHEFLDAQTFADYGCDFLKYDFCYFPETSDCAMLYRRMGNALKLCGRDILFSACCWGTHDVWSWARSAGVHMYRSTGDINDTFVSFSTIAKSQMKKFCYSGNQCFNDMDMLTVGMYGKGLVSREESKLTLEDYKTQFGLWCLMGTPLMLGNDLRIMTPEILELITNKELIAINQDPECRPAFIANAFGDRIPDVVVLVRMLANGDLGIGFFNLFDAMPNGHAGSRVNLLLENIGFPAPSGYGLKLKDVFTGEDCGVKSELISIDNLAPHACRIFRATPVKL